MNVLQLMTRPAAQLLFPNQRLQRWAFDVELVHLAQVLKVPMAEVQVTWTEIPGSKVRLTSIAHIAFELAMLKIAYGSGMWRVHGPNEVNKRE
jgi:dolichyl-phosphate beta-glucosyltransferase